MTQHTTTEAISHATVQVAHELNAASIITDTQTGYSCENGIQISSIGSYCSGNSS